MVMKEMDVERSTIRSILANIKQFLCGDACAAHRIYPNSNIFFVEILKTVRGERAKPARITATSERSVSHLNI